MATLSPKEIELLESIGGNKILSQRDLAKSASLSLGLVNIIIRKFVREGYIRINHLNKKKVEYLLTPLGLSESERITSADTNETIQKFKQIETQLVQMLQELHTNGYRYFSIHGNGELRQLLESTFKSSLGNTSACLEETDRNQPDSIVLNLMIRPPEEEFSGNVIRVLEKIRTW